MCGGGGGEIEGSQEMHRKLQMHAYTYDGIPHVDRDKRAVTSLAHRAKKIHDVSEQVCG